MLRVLSSHFEALRVRTSTYEFGGNSSAHDVRGTQELKILTSVIVDRLK